MQHAGLEWAYRLGHEPRRLFRRYAMTNPIAAIELFRSTH
jgi:UDP-N-acetyl-D-mannosaminuronic acid transferase (WecB/TagA/CpsF family)